MRSSRLNRPGAAGSQFAPGHRRRLQWWMWMTSDPSPSNVRPFQSTIE
jgi:hypothetical protein